MYNTIYVKSNYSLLSSLLTLNDIIALSKKRQQQAVFLCDDNMYATIEFIKLCQQENVKPVIGLEMHLENHTLLAFVKDYKGYQNLIKLSTLQNINQLTSEAVIEHQESLLFILPFSSLDFFEAYHNVLTELYVGYRNLEEEAQVLTKTKQLVYLPQCLYKEAKEQEILRYLYMIRDGKTISDDVSYELADHQFLGRDTLAYSHNEGLLNTLKIADSCHLVLPKATLCLPLYKCPNNLCAEEYLQELSKAGLKRRLKEEVPTSYKKRLMYELTIINRMGFANYFLIVYDFIRYAKKRHILVGPGRGSAAGSLVAYCLGITEIDPLHYDLLFERFLNPERVSMPDIDTDLPDAYRSEVITYVTEKYGKKNVAGIVTFATLAAKQVLRDVGRVLNIPLYKIDKLTSYLPAMSKDKLSDFLKTNASFRTFLENDPTLQKLYQIALTIEGFPRQIGTHAAGIVMSQYPLDEILPLTMSDGLYLTSYSMNYLEELGLLKMDFLGIKNLTLIMNIIKDSQEETLDFNTIPLDDPAVFSLFKEGNTSGIFQFESPGMRNFLRKLKPNDFEDIVAAIALFRPGPAANIDTYIARKEKKEPVTYPDPILEPILKKTHGIMIYQEQIMQVASLYAGYSLGEADILRRAISKKKLEVLQQEQTKFQQKAQEKGRDPAITKQLFDLILKFAGYGFNRSHAVAYSLVAYKMGYLKVHAQKAFYANLLSNVIGIESKTRQYLVEVRSQQISVVKPEINQSSDRFTLNEEGIVFPFSSIKGIGVSVCKTILSSRGNQPFEDLFAAFSRLVIHKVTKKQLEALIYADCFRQFGYSKRALIEQLESLMNYAELTKDLDPSLVLLPELAYLEEYSKSELLEQEQQTFGFYISNHPTTMYIKQYPHVCSLETLEKYYNRRISVLVMIEKIKTITTKKGETMAFFSGSDATRILDFTLFPRIYQNYQQVEKGDLCLITGKVEKRLDQIQMIVDKLQVIRRVDDEKTVSSTD